MQRLPDEEKLRRGVGVLLNSQDKSDLMAMARSMGISQSALIREVVTRELDGWRRTRKKAPRGRK